MVGLLAGGLRGLIRALSKSGDRRCHERDRDKYLEIAVHDVLLRSWPGAFRSVAGFLDAAPQRLAPR